jgi:predicted RNA binding protein YcfA (HicA-like mRNA interferase family)
MNPRYRILKPREVGAILERMGFVTVVQRGSHVKYRHADGRQTSVPFHKGRDISPILLREIVGQIGVTLEQFYEYDEN